MLHIFSNYIMCELQDVCNTMVQFLFFLCSFGEVSEWSSSCITANVFCLCRKSDFDHWYSCKKTTLSQKSTLDHLANADDSIGPGLVMACIVCCRQSCNFLLHTVLCPAQYPNTVNITPNHIGVYYPVDISTTVFS